MKWLSGDIQAITELGLWLRWLGPGPQTLSLNHGEQTHPTREGGFPGFSLSSCSPGSAPRLPPLVADAGTSDKARRYLQDTYCMHSTVPDTG